MRVGFNLSVSNSSALVSTSTLSHRLTSPLCHLEQLIRPPSEQRGVQEVQLVPQEGAVWSWS